MKWLFRFVFYSLFFSLVFLFVYNYHEEIAIFIRDYVVKERSNIVIDNDDYTVYSSYSYVQKTNDFIAKDKNHLKNIFYTILNSGNDEFTFFCDDNYSSCLNDVKEFSNDSIELSKINNFVHPYHSFSRVNVQYTSKGKVTVMLDKMYSDDEIIKVSNEVRRILEQTDKYKSDKDKIRYIHDYIINNSKYHSTSEDAKKNPDNHKAIGVLFNHFGLCGSYTDAMAIFLTELKIPNYKIASDTHIWNLVYLNGDWYHLDLTWDDPVVSDGKDYLQHDFFLVNTKKLHELDHEVHNFDYDTYKEALY